MGLTTIRYRGEEMHVSDAMGLSDEALEETEFVMRDGSTRPFLEVTRKIAHGIDPEYPEVGTVYGQLIDLEYAKAALSDADLANVLVDVPGTGWTYPFRGLQRERERERSFAPGHPTFGVVYGQMVDLNWANRTLSEDHIYNVAVNVPGTGWIRPWRFCPRGRDLKFTSKDGILSF